MCKIASGAGRGHVHGYNMILLSEKMGSGPLEIAVCREGSKKNQDNIDITRPFNLKQHVITK